MIRKILQELEYQSTTSSMNTRNDMKLGKVVFKVNDTSKQVAEVSGTRVRIDTVTNKDVKTVAGYDVDIDDSALKNVVTDEGPRSSTSFVKAMPEEVVKHKPSVSTGVYFDVSVFLFLYLEEEHSNITGRQGGEFTNLERLYGNLGTLDNLGAR